MRTHFDLIAIGGGSGGLAVAEQAAQYGKHVAIIEAKQIGGTCVNNGCVPKKIMWYAAHLAQAVDDAPGFGIPAQRQHTDWGALVEARDAYIQNIRRYWTTYLHGSGITRIAGHARFIDTKHLEVDGKTYSADHIVIASGSRPILPTLPGAQLGIDSDGFFALQQQPKKVAVIGGGYIGAELSSLLQSLGSQVSLVALESRLLPRFDTMLSEQLMTHMREQGISVHTNWPVAHVQRVQKGLRLISNTGQALEGFDSLIWAVGRRPNTDTLNLEQTGVQHLANGEITVDAFQNTNVPGIYAIGDVCGGATLTPVAIAAGRQLAKRLFTDSPHAKLNSETVPTVVFTHPPVATVGLSEAQARERYADAVSIYRSQFTPMRHALSKHAAQTAMKLICAGPDEKIVGMHMIGDNADEILQGFAVALNMGARKADFDNTLAIHPSSAEEWVTLRIAETDESLQEAATAQA